MLIDYREGSYLLAMYEPVRSLLPVCSTCNGSGTQDEATNTTCADCYSTGRQLCTLNSGDVAIPGNGPFGSTLVGIEVKTFSDLISSLDSGRLQATQIPAMCEDYPDERWLLIIGDYRPSPTNYILQVRITQFECSRESCKNHRFYNNYKRLPECPKCGSTSDVRTLWYNWTDYTFGGGSRPYSFIESFLSGPSLSSYGFRVKSVPDYETAAVWLATIAISWSRDYKSHRSMKVTDQSRRIVCPPTMDSRTYARLEHAMKLPGVGYELGMSMANSFDSVRAMYMATPETLAEVYTTSGKGRRVKLGKTRADAINKYLS